MAQATDFTIANQSFPSFRSDLNTVLGAINTMNSGSSRPSSAVSGTFWLDTTSATAPILKFFDGTDDITFATFNTTANTVNVSDSATDVVGDTTPQLGGDLDVNGNSIVSTSNGDVNLTPNGTGRIVLGNASVTEFDPKGRMLVLIPSELRKYAELINEKQISLIGMGNKFEIWNVSNWEMRQTGGSLATEILDVVLPESIKSMSF